MDRLWQKRIIDIYIIKEVLLPFLVGVAIIAVIMLSSLLFELTDFIIVKKIPVILVVQILFYKLPEIIVQTFPISILFATMSGMSRLNRENEFTALRMGGISLYRLILPLVFLGLIVSGGTYFINEEVVPWANHEAQNIIRRSILQKTLPDIQDNVFFKGPEGRLFYVNKYDEKNNTLEKIVIYNFSTENGYPEIITANMGKVDKNKWLLADGIVHQYSEDGHLTLETQFAEMEIELAKDAEKFFGEQRTTAEMSRRKLKEEIDLFKKSGINVCSLLVDYHLKLAMPLAALIFILVGTPLSLSSKDSRSASIIFTIIIVFSYYLVLSLAQSFGKNGQLLPLLAAWLPNIFFALIGVLLLICREAWQNLLNKMLRIFAIFILMFIIMVPEVEAQVNKIKIDQADYLHYLGEKEFELTGDIRGQYQQLHLLADKVVVKLVDDEGKEQEIELNESSLSGCELADPHYFFKAEEVVIYPNDYLVAKNVTFWELNGKLPLFYWPYLYLSLKDKSQSLLPEVGYNATRGWFIKLTYRYLYKQKLPGELYLDYYNISGYGAGFKQFFLYEPELKGYLYLYGQENRTNIPGLFQWQGEVNLEDKRGDLRTDTDLKYTFYDDHSFLRGNLYLTRWADKQYLNLSSKFKSKDYFLSDNTDDKNLDLDFAYRLKLFNSWNLNLKYNHDYLFNPEDGLKERWGSKSYLAKRIDDFNFKIMLERYAPKFSDEEKEQVTFYRWPEVEIKYLPWGSFSYDFLLGRYYEDRSELLGYRALGEIKYNRRFSLTKNMSLRTIQTVGGRLYKLIENEEGRNIDYLSSLATYQSQYDLRTVLAKGLIWNNKYSYTGSMGETPFNFDKLRFKERIDSDLSYRRGNLRLTLGTGYDFYQQDYSPLKGFLRWRVIPAWVVELGTYYYLDTQTFGDLAVKSRYKDDRFKVNSALKYSLNDGQFSQLDNQFVYDLKDEWYLELNTSIDYEKEAIKKANILLKKNFHCRQLWFSYDYIEKEFTVEYHINLFPDKGVKFGSSEEEPFMFDLGIDDILGDK